MARPSGYSGRHANADIYWWSGGDAVHGCCACRVSGAEPAPYGVGIAGHPQVIALAAIIESMSEEPFVISGRSRRASTRRPLCEILAGSPAVRISNSDRQRGVVAGCAGPGDNGDRQLGGYARRGCQGRPAACGRRARLQRAQPDPAAGEAGGHVRRPTGRGRRQASTRTGTTSGTTSRPSGSSPRSQAPAATSTFAETASGRPGSAPTVSKPGKDVTHWFELSVAPWISTTVCDPNSAPLTAVHAPLGQRMHRRASTRAAAPAFVELQFYPPGFAPFDDSISCDNTHWCSALTIDSLECTGKRVRAVQQQLRRAGQLRLHPDQRRAHRAAEPAAQQPGHLHAQRAHAADEPRGQDHRAHVRREDRRAVMPWRPRRRT